MKQCYVPDLSITQPNMNKNLKEETDQSSIKEFILSSTSSKRTSSPLKWKKTDSGDIPRSQKKTITSPDITTMAGRGSEQTEDPRSAPVNQNVMLALKMLLEPMRTEIRNLTKSHLDIKTNISENTLLKAENIALIKRVKAVKQINEDLNKRVCELENRLFETNLIIHGIRESAWETDDVLTEKIYDAMTETVLGRNYDNRLETVKLMPIKSAKRLGIYSSVRSRPISVEFLYRSDADYLMNNKKYLGEGIYIDCEYCKASEEKRRILRPFLKAARKLPRYHKKCRLDGEELVLRGVSYTVDKLDRLPEELQGNNISSKSNDHTFGFFGSLNPLSNYHDATFILNGVAYKNSEQMIQHKKAEYFGDNDVATRIMQCTTGYECKKLSKEIHGFDRIEWENHAKNLSSAGLFEKYKQNPRLKVYLLATGEKTIVEASYDPIWGTGVPLDDEAALTPRRWSSQGILGEMLKTIRSQLRTDADPCPMEEHNPELDSEDRSENVQL